MAHSKMADGARPRALLPRRKRAPLTRSEVMARIRSKDTLPEVRLYAGLKAAGLRFRRHVDNLPGKPDLANKRKAWAVFVHGCFWHSHRRCWLASKPKSNSEYWRQKLERNIRRDRAKVRELRRLGYRVFIVWECETRKGSRLRTIVRDLSEKLGSNLKTEVSASSRGRSRAQRQSQIGVR